MYARHEAMLRQRTDDGAETRAYLEASAAKGNAEAIERLRGPEFPEDMEYLWVWALEMHGRSGANMAGLNPLTYGTIRDWSALTEQYPDPLEVQALMAVDAALRSPETTQDDKPAPKPPAWPTRKAHG